MKDLAEELQLLKKLEAKALNDENKLNYLKDIYKDTKDKLLNYVHDFLGTEEIQ